MKRSEWETTIESLCREMGINRSLSEDWQQVLITRRTIRRLSLRSLCICFGIVAALEYASHRFALGHATSTTLFGGAPQFIVLALIMALAAYLRSVRADTIKARETVRLDTPWPKVPDRTFTKYVETRKSHLDRIVMSLSVAGPFI